LNEKHGNTELDNDRGEDMDDTVYGDELFIYTMALIEEQEQRKKEEEAGVDNEAN
jgi:hypothetical protein